MDIEILINATIRECGEEDKELLFREVKEEIANCVRKIAGEPNTKKGLWFYLENVTHQVALESEGSFKFEDSIKCICDACSKQDNPTCVGNTKTFYKGVIVVCSGFKLRPES